MNSVCRMSFLNQGCKNDTYFLSSYHFDIYNNTSRYELRRLGHIHQSSYRRRICDTTDRSHHNRARLGSNPLALHKRYISIEIEIQWNFVMLLFITYSADHNDILHTSRQLYCRDVCKISLWSARHILNQSNPNFGRISPSYRADKV